MRLALVTGKATSLINVSKDIAYISQKLGYAPRILNYVESPSSLARISDAVILVYPASPLFCAEYMLLYRELTVHYKMPCIYYTMVEGRLRRYHISEWMSRDLEFVACSRYVQEKLQEAGFRVKGVVHHGLVREVVNEATKLVPIAKKHLKAKYEDKVVFGVVSHTHVRKGLDYLVSAIHTLSQKRDDFIVHLVSTPEAIRKYSNVPHLVVDTVFGTRAREEILAFMGAIDFLILPSLAEGFGLTIVEANAMGTLAIHGEYPPLTEVSDLENNITFPYRDIQYINTEEGIEYEFHLYDPKELADAMENAIEMKKKYKSELEDRQAKVKEALNRFDADILYRKLIGMLK